MLVDISEVNRQVIYRIRSTDHSAGPNLLQYINQIHWEGSDLIILMLQNSAFSIQKLFFVCLFVPLGNITTNIFQRPIALYSMFGRSVRRLVSPLIFFHIYRRMSTMLKVWSPPSQLVPISQLVPNIQVVPTVNCSPPILPYISHQKFPLNTIQNCPPKNQDLIFAQFTWSSLHLSPL